MSISPRRNKRILGMTMTQIAILASLAIFLCCIALIGTGLIVYQLQFDGNNLITRSGSNTSTPPLPTTTRLGMPTLPPEWTPTPTNRTEASPASQISAREFRRQALEDFNKFYAPAMDDLAKLLTSAASNPSYRQDKQWQENVAAALAMLKVTANALAKLDGPSQCGKLEQLFDEFSDVTNAFVDHQSKAIVTLSDFEVEQAGLYSDQMNSLVDNINEELNSGSCG